jgi:hypothetical protein
MAEAVYLSCALVSVACAALLIRNYRRAPLRLALFAALCFCGLALNNILLFVDLVVTPQIDLSVWRGVVAVIAMFLLLVGLILEGR